ncbi:acyltransferase [Rhodoferax saidenbachensis]|nr:acyltransferase [Rhodoferax saidenbachensis]
MENRQTLINVQYLRAIAALMVVWVHARDQFDWLKIQFPSGAGAAGVDLFFVISGFIMVYTTYGKKISPLDFMLRRIERIAPLYWAATLAILCVAAVAPALLKSTVLSGPHILASLAFLPMLSPAFPNNYWPLHIPGWTLNYEMAFYLLFSVSLLAHGVWRIVLLGICLVGVVIGGIFWQLNGVWKFYSDAIILIFLAGAMVGYFMARIAPAKNAFMGTLLLSAGIMLWIFLQSAETGHRLWSAGMPATIIVLGALVTPNVGTRFLAWLETLGDASYSIYLSHIFCLAGLRVLSKLIGFVIQDNFHGWIFMFVCLIACSATGVFVFKYIEKPLASKVRDLHHKMRTKMRVGTANSAG